MGWGVKPHSFTLKGRAKMITELYGVNPSTLDVNSTYDFTEHMPFPKMDYVRAETGVDMVIGVGGSTQANATLRYLTKLMMNVIKDSIMPVSRPKVEFLIAKDIQYRKAFIDSVCSLVLTTRGKGISELLESGQLDKASLSKVVQATASILFTNQYNFQLHDTQIRSDY
jgi:hypothetical protein